MSWPAAVPAIITALGGLFGKKKKKHQTVAQSFDDGAFRAAQAEINRLLAVTNQQQIDFNELIKKHSETEKKLEEFQRLIDEQKIDSFEKLTAHQRKQFDAAVEVCRTVPATPFLPPNTVGFIGKCGAGKSYLINAVSGKPGLCAVGKAQTTMEIKPYIVNNVAYMDIPGTTQVITYLSADYIGVFKALKFIGVVMDRTIDDICNICILLERLEIPYVIIVNKCDADMEEEGGIENFKEKVKKEFLKHSFGSINMEKDVYFLSAKLPNTPGTNWLEFVQRMVDKVGAENYYPRPVRTGE